MLFRSFSFDFNILWASLVAHLIKNLPTMRETWVRPLVWEDLLEKGKAAAAAAKLLQSCPTLCNGSPPGSPVPGILQGRILEWIAVPSPGDLPNPGIKPRSPALWADSLPTELSGKP